MVDCQKKSYNEFIDSIKKVKDSRTHKINNSLGVYDSYKWIRKNKWLNIGRPLTEHEFYSIIRTVNNYLVENFLAGHDIKFPYNMGTLELRKYPPTYKINNGKVETNFPIDWDETLKLWYEDKEAFNNKTLVRFDRKELFRVIYNKKYANYTNEAFYEFRVNNDFKRRIHKRVKDGMLDAFTTINNVR